MANHTKAYHSQTCTICGKVFQAHLRKECCSKTCSWKREQKLASKTRGDLGGQAAFKE